MLCLWDSGYLLMIKWGLPTGRPSLLTRVAGGTYKWRRYLGTMPGLIARRPSCWAIILTVAVSVAAGVAAIYSLFPDLRP